ncbi:uncharacterized protein (TIGR02679 family) [Catenulispora sp. MAP12-49]|uniref:TIGR02679 family protein n=1 Tax=Catenulispora sp. MAP12-49 TaxID=3156302 RepID=UPI0035172A7F
MTDRIPAGLDMPRLQRLLGSPDTAWLVDRVAERIASGTEPAHGTATLADPAPAQRRALELLLGRPPGRGKSLTARLADVDTVLRESGISPDGLVAAVQALRGPIAVRREVETAADRAWESALEPLDRLAADRPDLTPWLQQVRATGLLKRQATDPIAGAGLAEQAARVLSALPHPGIVRPILAAQTVGHAHALDDGRPLTALVLSAIRSLTGLAASDTATSEGRRDAWAGAGVAADDLSSRILALNVPPPRDEGFLPRLLRLGAAAGQPLVLTLRDLNSLPTATTTTTTTTTDHTIAADLTGTTISVCENPAVVSAAATALGSTCPPLVCLEGTPSVAANRLLRQLLARGANLRYHGDFDWGGIRIATSVFNLAEQSGAPAAPWRYDSAAYLEAVARRLGTALPQAKTRDTPWDPDLRHHIETHALRVEEEHVIDTLLTDLTRHRTSPA